MDEMTKEHESYVCTKKSVFNPLIRLLLPGLLRVVFLCHPPSEGIVSLFDSSSRGNKN